MLADNLVIYMAFVVAVSPYIYIYLHVLRHYEIEKFNSITLFCTINEETGLDPLTHFIKFHFIPNYMTYESEQI